MSDTYDGYTYVFGPAGIRFLVRSRSESEPPSYDVEISTPFGERLQIYISPTGRSVRVWKGNTELKGKGGNKMNENRDTAHGLDVEHVARPQVKVEPVTGRDDWYAAICYSCDPDGKPVYRNCAKTDVQIHATWHRQAHRDAQKETA